MQSRQSFMSLNLSLDRRMLIFNHAKTAERIWIFGAQIDYNLSLLFRTVIIGRNNTKAYLSGEKVAFNINIKAKPMGKASLKPNYVEVKMLDTLHSICQKS